MKSFFKKVFSCFVDKSETQGKKVFFIYKPITDKEKKVIRDSPE